MGSLLSCTECGLPGDVGGLVVHGRVEKQEFASFSFLSVALEMGKRKNTWCRGEVECQISVEALVCRHLNKWASLSDTILSPI